MPGPVAAAAAIRADNKKLKRDLDKSRRLFSRTFQRIGSGVKSKLSSALSPLGVGAGVAGLAAVGKQVVDFEDQLNRLEIQSGASGAEIDRFRATIDSLSRSTGISRDELLSGATALVNLQGKAGFSTDQLRVLANTNLATGATMADLAGLTFSLGNAFELTDPDKLQRGLSAIITAGKEGAVPLNEMSLVLQQVASDFKDVGGRGVQGAADMAAAIQILRRGFGSASEAGTGLRSLITALTKKAPELRRLGINVFERKGPNKGQFRGIRQIFDDFERKGLSIEKLTKTLGKTEAKTALKTLLEFRNTKIIDGKELIGFEELVDAAVKSNAVIEDSQKRRQSKVQKLKVELNKAKLELIDAFTPERIKLFVDVMSQVVRLLAFALDHSIELIAVWATFKGAVLVTQFQQIAASTAAASSGSASLLANLGKAGALAGALAGGFALGGFIDDLFGLSDSLAGLGPGGRKKDRGADEVSGSLASGARQRVIQGAQAAGILDLDQRSEGRAQIRLRNARESGFLNAAGTGAASDESLFRSLADRGVETSQLPAQVEDLKRQIRESFSIVERAQRQRQQVDVRVTVDQAGRVNSVDVSNPNAARSPQ